MDTVFVYDLCEKTQTEAIKVKISRNYNDFRKEIIRQLWCGESRQFVVCNSDREVINDKNFSLIQADDTYFVLKNADQELPGQVNEKINFEPHYDVLVKSGLYEYYASKGRNPLPYALAELIDNSLSATANNKDEKRLIEVRFYLDTDKPQNSVVLVIDNGNGMRSQDLANWAKYKYSKFNRVTRDFTNNVTGSPLTSGTPRAKETSRKTSNEPTRFLNSQISYFGAGGKQAVFFIGNAVRMISKSKISKDVHELFLSESEFQKKQQNKEKIFETTILNRKPGDASHIGNKLAGCEVLRRVISEENKESFTCVAITEMHEHHLEIFNDLDKLGSQLAHIYHYYLHGPDGNVEIKADGKAVKKPRLSEHCKNLEIIVNRYDLMKCPVVARTKRKNGVFFNFETPTKSINLRDVDSDIQTSFVRSSAASFEFKAELKGGGNVEGVVRYHPFLYDRETYPNDPFLSESNENGENEEEVEAESGGRGSRPIFECFWNGRLIPYDNVETLDWCSAANKKLTPECLNRISGVLFVSDEFEVTQNKLTFKDSVEKRLRDNEVAYTFLHGTQYRRGIEDNFKKWLENCHAAYDKEIKFLNFQMITDRKNDPSVPKSKQYPWSEFNGVEMVNQKFMKGCKVKTIRTVPIMVGTVTRFLVGSDFDLKFGESCFGTCGFFEMIREPRSLYSETRVYPLSRLDTAATKELIDSFISKDEERLPALLDVTWVASEVMDGSTIKAGIGIGAIKVDVMDKHNKTLNGKLPGSSKKNINVALDVQRREHNGNNSIVHHAVSTTRSPSWFYWFKEIDPSVISRPGDYKIILQSGFYNNNNCLETKLGTKDMPSKEIEFTVVGGDPKCFVIDEQKLIRNQRIGIAFTIPLILSDNYDNRVFCATTYNAEVKCKDKDVIDVTCDGTVVHNGQLFVKKVILNAKLPSENGKEYTLSVKIEDICKKLASPKIAFKPGPPAKLQVFPEETQLIENGTLPKYGALLFDCAGNPVTHKAEKDLIIHCNFFDIANDGKRGELICGPYALDFVTGPDGKECALKGTPAAIQIIKLAKGVKKEIIAELSVKGYQTPPVQKRLLVQASCKPTSIKLFCSSEFDESLIVEITKDLEWTAGSMIKNIHFKIFDDVGNELQKPNLSATNLKLSWASFAEVSKSDVKNYRLPNMKVSTSTENPLYQNVNLICPSETNDKQSVLEFHFTLKPRPGPATQLKVTMPASIEVPAGQGLPYDIEVKVADKYMNGVSGITEISCSNLKVSCDSSEIDEEAMKKELGQKEGVMLIKNLKFKDTMLGMRNITLQYDDLKEIIVVEAVPGAPKKLKWEFNTQWDGKTVTVSRNGYLDIAVQVYDEFENKCPVDDKNIILGLERGLEFQGANNAITNSEGKANFGHKTFSISSDLEPRPCPLKTCDTKCFGVFKLACKATIRPQVSVHSVCQVHMLCDLTLPHKFNIGYAGELQVVAGEEFPYFYVSMLAEDEKTTVTAVTADQMKLELTRDGSESNLLDASSFEDGNYSFENLVITKAGDYKVQFVFKDTRFEEPKKSQQLSIKVLPSAPCSFMAVNEPPSTLIASNTADPNSRRILQGRQLKLVLLDKYNNVVSSDDTKYDGGLIVEIIADPNLNDISEVNSNEIKIPKFQGNESSMKFDIKGGSALVSNIMLQEKTPGDDGVMYCLRFTPAIEGLELQPFSLPFTFYNEAEKLFETKCLEEKKEQLKKKIQECDNQIHLKRKKVDEIMAQSLECKRKENIMSQRLREAGCSGSDVNSLNNIEAISKFIESKKAEKVNLETKDKERRRNTGQHRLNPAANESGVLGKIGHLALLDDPTDARVLSWHLSGDMDCIVTYSSEKAKELNSRYNGREQLLPLDAIFRGGVQDWSGRLPHERIQQLRNSNYRPPGNPVVAKMLFYFPKEVEKCRTVFGNLLGETILMDNVSDALEYRKMIVQFSNCPTILTRQGERLRNNGKFGGHGNRMPQNVRYVFDITPNPQIQKLDNQISVLNELSAATRESVEVARKLEETQEKTKVELNEIEKSKRDYRMQFDECDAKIRDLRRMKRAPSTSIDTLRGGEGDKRRR